MKTLNFKITLLSDIIINQRAATEGNQQTLDFIPGNALLGVAAGAIYKNKSEESFNLFHSGKVRFGDAHPYIEGKRALKVPASWYKKKDDKDDKELFVHHGLPENGLKDNGNPVQIKQYREDFIVKQNRSQVAKVETDKHFAIKSAYDRTKRRSEDAKMFGYESLGAGSEWCFDVVIENLSKELEVKLIGALAGKRRIGRSSTAQYGLVEIEKIERIDNLGFGKWENPKVRDIDKPVVFVYAESRLIFFDQFGQPTNTPSSVQLGFPGGEIYWEMSQVRTFQYAPYNNKRKTRDSDRMGIEKGSVFCITGVSSSETEIWIGSFQNEGFGKVLINPDFLEFSGEMGKAKFTFAEKNIKNNAGEPNIIPVITNDKPVLEYLKQQKKLKEDQRFIFEKVNDFVTVNSKHFKDDTFASQWGTIRSLAMQFSDPEILKQKIFSGPDSYLNHGVAAEKWSERGRIKLFRDFINEFAEKDNLIPEAIINLSAEMAKKCRRN